MSGFLFAAFLIFLVIAVHNVNDVLNHESKSALGWMCFVAAILCLIGLVVFEATQ